MLLGLYVLAGLVLGATALGALRRLDAALPGSALGPAADLLDAIAGTAVLGVAVWVGASWTLALVGALRPGPLVTAGGLELAAAAAWIARLTRHDARASAVAWWGRTLPTPPRTVLVAIAMTLAPVALWTAFVAWRGTVLPVYNHDALAYHLPKAALLAQSGRFAFFDVPEPRIASWPCNYEMLLADTLLLTGGDAWTAALATFSYVVLALLAARTAAVWWGGGAHVALAAAFVATAPIVVLHSGLHKNDLFFAVFAVAAMTWGARWVAVGSQASAVLTIVALLLAAGTKANAAFLVASAGPLLAWGAWRHRAVLRRVQLAAATCATVWASFLLGGAVYLINLAKVHAPILRPASMVSSHLYGNWSVIWQFTAMLLIAPFSRSSNAVWNPFRGQYWWWPANDVWASHFGMAFTVFVALLGPCVAAFRRRLQAPVESAAMSLSGLAAYLVTLPILGGLRPTGFFSGEVRYVLFVLPIVAAWTLCPLAIALERVARSGAGLVRVIAALGAAVYGGLALLRYGVQDEYAPFKWVVYEFHHPDDRTPFVRRNRAANRFDAVAPADAACAVDVGFDTWIYPAYGAGLTRRVEFLDPSPGAVRIPRDVDWVLVDRSWNIFFGDPRFVDMGQAQYLGRGRPSADDLKVYRQLRQDSSFELVYDDRSQNQAVFYRRPLAPAP